MTRLRSGRLRCRLCFFCPSLGFPPTGGVPSPWCFTDDFYKAGLRSIEPEGPGGVSSLPLVVVGLFWLGLIVVCLLDFPPIQSDPTGLFGWHGRFQESEVSKTTPGFRAVDSRVQNSKLISREQNKKREANHDDARCFTGNAWRGRSQWTHSPTGLSVEWRRNRQSSTRNHWNGAKVKGHGPNAGQAGARLQDINRR